MMSVSRRPHLAWVALTGVATLWLSLAVAQTDAGGRFGGLDQEMTAEERAAAGIDQLEPTQIEFLNRWLRERFNQVEAAVASEVTAATTAAAVAERDAAIQAEVERRVAAEVEAAREEIRADDEAERNDEPFEAVVTGDFRGWSGNTVFVLDNGQVWRQRHGTNYRYQDGDNRVRFEKNFFGLWEMTVLSSGRSVGVRRID